MPAASCEVITPPPHVASRGSGSRIGLGPDAYHGPTCRGPKAARHRASRCPASNRRSCRRSPRGRQGTAGIKDPLKISVRFARAAEDARLRAVAIRCVSVGSAGAKLRRHRRGRAPRTPSPEPGLAPRRHRGLRSRIGQPERVVVLVAGHRAAAWSWMARTAGTSSATTLIVLPPVRLNPMGGPEQFGALKDAPECLHDAATWIALQAVGSKREHRERKRGSARSSRRP